MFRVQRHFRRIEPAAAAAASARVATRVSARFAAGCQSVFDLRRLASLHMQYSWTMFASLGGFGN